MIRKLSAALAAVLLLMLLGGCGNAGARTEPEKPSEPAASTEPAPPAEPEKPAEPAGSTEPVPATEPEKPSETETVPARQDGERFEAVIMLEGMEETVRYEHIRNEMLGIEMDYDYELFERHSEPDSECFICVYDGPDHPENFLTVTALAKDAETAAASIGDKLSEKYDINTAPFLLERAGSCIRIDASADKGGLTMPDQLQMVYIIPADDGCRVAVAYYAIEGAEGFGRRFAYMMQTLSLID